MAMAGNEAIDIGSVHMSAQHISRDTIMYLTCVSHESIRYQITTCPCFTVRVREGHVSFMDRQADRYLVLLCESQALKLDNIPAPCVIRINSAADLELCRSITKAGYSKLSVIHSVVKQFLDAGEDGEPLSCRAVLLHEIAIEPSLPSALTPLQSPPSLTIQGMPQVEPNSTCNCTSRSRAQLFVVCRQNAEIQTAVSNNEQQSAQDPPDGNIHKLKIPVRGSTYHPEFQKALSPARKAGSKLEVEFKMEPENPKDKNALLVIVKCLEKHKPIGYVGGTWLRAVHQAINNHYSAKLSQVLRCYNPQCNTYYKAEIHIYKEGKWPKEDYAYEYNDII